MFNDKKADRLLNQYRKKNFDAVHKEILATLEDFNKKVYITLTGRCLKEIDTFLGLFFHLILRKDFSIEKYAKEYLFYITLVENLTFLSGFKTTENILKKLLEAPDSEVHKILLLLNLKVDIDFSLVDSLFQQDSVLGSYWLYSVYSRHNFCNDRVSQNLQVLQKKLLSYDLHPFENISSVYFNSTYINPENHLLVRKKVNETIKRHIPLAPVKNTSRLNKIPKIAVVSGNWGKDRAVQKCIGAFIEGLCDDYELVLVQIHSRADSDIQDYFKEVYTVKKNGDFIEYGSIVENDFNIVIFPDIGLNTESLVLSNLRIAPVQIAMYGHPVSSASKETDYFFVGELSESEDVQKYYTEKVVPIKGPGMNSVRPAVERPSFKEKSNCLFPGAFNIFVSSSATKINATIKYYWKRIIDESKRPVILNLLPDNAGMQELSVLTYELENLYGRDNIKIHRQKEYSDYMEVIKQCDLAIGSYHYGDYNRVVDSLWMGTPIVVVQGRCGYQNTGVGALKATGLDELIAQDLDEYVSMTLQLIEDDDRRKSLQERIISLDIENRLIDNSEYTADFKEKIRMLLKN